jgi:hypothetical protein
MSEMSNFIHAHDLAQAGDGTARARLLLTGEPTGKRCPQNPEHGLLGVHGTGQGLVCCAITGKNDKGYTFCGYSERLLR